MYRRTAGVPKKNEQRIKFIGEGNRPTKKKERVKKMKKEKLYKASEKFTIYRNYGVLSKEKRNVYTFGGETGTAICSDKMIVRLPENDSFGIYETVSGSLAVESAWGWNYDINDILQGNEDPCFYALDDSQKGHRVKLEVIE